MLINESRCHKGTERLYADWKQLSSDPKATMPRFSRVPTGLCLENLHLPAHQTPTHLQKQFRFMRIILTTLALSLSFPTGLLAAEPTMCSTRINGKDIVLGYDKEEARLSETYSRREQLAARVGRHDCPSYVVLRSLTPELTDDQRLPFCLRQDEDSDSVIGYDLGDRDAWGHCKVASSSVCSRVNQATGAAGALSSTAARKSVAGLHALPDASGAVIVSGTGSVISGALASLGGAAAVVAASPVLLTGAAVSVVAVGGTVYACRAAN